VTSCGQTAVTGKQKSIVVTYSVLGSIVKQLVGDQAEVVVSVPNGIDIHEWEPSAKDIEAINKADLVIQNGLGLEAGLLKALLAAENSGVKIFTAADHIDVRHVAAGEGIPTGDPDQAIGASDPHLWMDPLAIKDVVIALVPVLKNELDLDVAIQAANLETMLENLNQEIAGEVSLIPLKDRKLVTGHESMGYFARRYDFKLVGVIIPSLSSQAEVTAGALADLIKAVRDNQVKAVFSELGTPAGVAKKIGDETGVKVVELNTHVLPDDGSYITFMRNVAGTITGALK